MLSVALSSSRRQSSRVRRRDSAPESRAGFIPTPHALEVATANGCCAPACHLGASGARHRSRCRTLRLGARLAGVCLLGGAMPANGTPASREACSTCHADVRKQPQNVFVHPPTTPLATEINGLPPPFSGRTSSLAPGFPHPDALSPPPGQRCVGSGIGLLPSARASPRQFTSIKRRDCYRG